MSTLKVTHLQNENGTGPAMSIAVGGGVTFAGISTFHNGVDSGERLTIGGSNVTDSNLLTLNGTGATQNVGLVLNKTNSPAKAYGLQVNNGTGDLIFYDYTANAERVRITGVGSFGVGNDDPTYRVSVKDTKADGTGVQMHLWNSSTNNVAGNVWSGIRFTGSTADYETAEIKGWRVHPGTGLNSLSFNTGGVERMVMSVPGVGIGTSNPEGVIHTLASSNNHLVLESSDSNVDIIGADTGGSTRIRSSGGQLTVYTGGDASAHNAANSSSAATFNTSGNLAFPSGQGIDFSADTNNGAMTSELLDDYEEGTWTPTIKENGTGTAWDTLSNQVGTYTKVGQLVTVTFYFDYSARASNVTTSFYGFIAGLPFTNTSTSTNGGAGTLLITQSGGSSTPYHMYLNVSQGNTLSVYGNQDSTTPGPLMTQEWPNVAARVRGQYFYYVP